MFTPNNRSESWLLIGLSTLTHILLVAPAIYILILVAGANYSLFIWHPTCLAIGCGFLMTEAVFALSGEPVLAGRVSRQNRIKIHWILHALGLIFLTVGFVAIVANKNRNNAPHFVSSHGKLGLSAFIITLIVALGGVLTLFTGMLANRISLATMKLIHGCGGIISIILLLAALITGLYRGWGSISDAGRILSVIAYVVGGILLLAKPIYSFCLRIHGIFT